jgi:hypothetical protein
LFDPSEWGDLCRDQTGIDANHAAFYRFGYFPNPADIAAIEITGKPKFSVIG